MNIQSSITDTCCVCKNAEASVTSAPVAVHSEKKRRPPSARMVLIAQALCVIMALLPIVAYNIWTEGTYTRRLQILAMQRMVQGLASRQVTLAESTKSLLFSMSLAPVVQSGNAEGIYNYLASVDRNQPDFDGFAVFNEKGETIAGLYDGQPRILTPDEIRSRSYFLNTIMNNEGGFKISRMLPLENGRSILPMTLPLVNAGGEVKGLIMASLSVARHQSLMESLSNDLSAGVFLYDGAFTPIFSYTPDSDAREGEAILNGLSLKDFFSEHAPIYQDGAQLLSGEFHLAGPDDMDFVGVCTALRLENDKPYMFIVGLMPELHWWSYIYTRYSTQLWATILVVLAVLFLSRHMGTHYFARGLERLSLLAQKTRTGDLAARCEGVYGCAEIVELSETVDSMLTSLETKNAELLRLSVLDPLTGLWNRRHFTEVAHHEVALAARQNYNIAVVMADIDHFKRINDTYGHTSGDLVLQQFAKCLRENMRVSDLVARYGGEEFILFFPATDSHGAEIALEKLRSATERLRIPAADGSIITFTASFGVASACPIRGVPENSILGDLQSRADAALYASKRNGRNMVTVG